MDSAEHQHGASAAPPPQAAPLPSESCNATKTKEPSAASTPSSTTPVSTPTRTSSAVPIGQTTPSQLAVPRSNFSATETIGNATKKRPLALVANMNPSLELSVPALKKNAASGEMKKIHVTNETSKKVTVTKTKKTLKKKKKFSSILSGMMKPKKTVDIHAERESLRKNLGGGNFSKITKI